MTEDLIVSEELLGGLYCLSATNAQSIAKAMKDPVVPDSSVGSAMIGAALWPE